jgi:hypothetical protein
MIIRLYVYKGWCIQGVVSSNVAIKLLKQCVHMPKHIYTHIYTYI